MEPPEEDYRERMKFALETAEVMSLFFMRVGQSLIIDARREGDGGAAIMLDDMVATPQDRLASFQRLRPGLPPPDRLTLAPWTGAVREFDRVGLLQVLLDRCEQEGGVGLRDQAATAFRALAKLERRYLRELVRGAGMHTIWQRRDS